MARPRFDRDTLRGAVSALNPGWTPLQWARAGAWLFIAVSLARLTWIVGSNWGAPGGTFDTIAGTDAHHALGLTYSGVPGFLWAGVQLLAVATATALSLTQIRKLRRIGHGVLIGWAGLWLANLLWLTTAEGGFDTFVRAALMSGLFVCTISRAVTSGRARPAPDAPPSLDREPDPFGFETDVAEGPAPERIDDDPVANEAHAHESLPSDVTPDADDSGWARRAGAFLGQGVGTAGGLIKRGYGATRAFVAEQWKRRQERKAEAPPASPSVSSSSRA